MSIFLNLFGKGKDENGKVFVAISVSFGKPEDRPDVYWLLRSSIHKVFPQCIDLLKECNGAVKFLIPTERLVFKKAEIETALQRLVQDWLLKWKASWYRVKINFSYADKADFEFKIHEENGKMKITYVPVQEKEL